MISGTGAKGMTQPAVGAALRSALRAKGAMREVITLAPIPGGSWAAAASQDLFPRYPPRVNDGTQAAPFLVGGTGTDAVDLIDPQVVRLGILPVGLFGHSGSHLESDIPGRYRLKPYTLTTGGADVDALTAGHRLAEAGLWDWDASSGGASRLNIDAVAGAQNGATFVPPYLSRPAGGGGERVVVLSLVVPPELAAAAAAAASPPPPAKADEAAAAAAHDALLTWQLQRVAEAAAFAGADGRALVLPRFVCATHAAAASGVGSEPHPTGAPFPCFSDSALRVSVLAETQKFTTRESGVMNQHKWRFRPAGYVPAAAGGAAGAVGGAGGAAAPASPSQQTLRLCALPEHAAAYPGLPACGAAALAGGLPAWDVPAGGTAQAAAAAVVAAEATAAAMDAAADADPQVLAITLSSAGLASAGFASQADADAFNALFGEAATSPTQPLPAAPAAA